jgi:hypothetical protein
MDLPILATPHCYYTTPAHQRTLFGRFIYLYQGKGSLALNETELRFVHNGLPTSIAITQISDVQIGSFSRWSKPFGLNYLAVTYQEGGAPVTLYLVPTISALTATWHTNVLVQQWFDLLTALRAGKPITVGRAL